MRAALLDTVGLLALWDKDDQWRQAASFAYRRLVGEGADLFTTSYILADCGNAASRSPYRLDVDELREQLAADRMLVFPTGDDWLTAWSAYRRGEAGDAGIVDQLSFAVMQRLGVTRAFTNDKHFRAAGIDVMF